jgi:hypothetical protein
MPVPLTEGVEIGRADQLADAGIDNLHRVCLLENDGFMRLNNTINYSGLQLFFEQTAKRLWCFMGARR